MDSCTLNLTQIGDEIRFHGRYLAAYRDFHNNQEAKSSIQLFFYWTPHANELTICYYSASTKKVLTWTSEDRMTIKNILLEATDQITNELKFTETDAADFRNLFCKTKVAIRGQLPF